MLVGSETLKGEGEWEGLLSFGLLFGEVGYKCGSKAELLRTRRTA